METYIISFKKGEKGLVANDAFQAIVDEYQAEGQTDAAGIFWVGETSVMNTYDNITISGPASKEIAKSIMTAYADYGPIVNVGTDFEESAVKSNYGSAFRAMRRGKLNEYCVNEALDLLKSAGYNISK